MRILWMILLPFLCLTLPYRQNNMKNTWTRDVLFALLAPHRGRPNEIPDRLVVL
jgi:hypothetical protein